MSFRNPPGERPSTRAEWLITYAFLLVFPIMTIVTVVWALTEALLRSAP